MAIDENLEEKIRDLRFNQHKTIRKIAKITGKSSRDIILVLKELGGEVKKQRCKKGVTEQGVRSREEPLHVKAFDLYSQGKSPVEVLKVLRLSETETTKYYMEYLRLVRLPGLSLTYEKLGSVHAVSFFAKLSNIAVAEGLTVEEVIRLLKIVEHNPLSYVEVRIKEIKKMLLCLELELEEQKNALFCYNEKIESAKLILNGWDNACRDLRAEVVRLYNEKQTLQNLVYPLKQNDNIYQKIQNIAEDKVKAFLESNDATRLLEYALVAVTEALRQDPQRQLLIEKTPSIQNYDLTIEQSFLPSYDYYYPNTAKEKVLESANKIYDKLVKGLADATVSTAAWNR
jgi:hypothetical protein